MPLLIFIARLLAKLPVTSYPRLGRWVGWLLLRLARKRVCIVRENLRLVFPELSPSEQDRLLEQHFAHLAEGLFELIKIWFSSDKSSLSLIERANVTGLDHWQAVAGKQGVILCVFHHAHIEAMGLLLGQLGQVHPVYRPQDNETLESYGTKARSRWTAGAVSNREVKQMIRLLKNKQTLWLAPDQRNRSSGVPIPFMGQKPLTHLSIARIARMTNSTIIPVTCHQTPDHQLALTFHPAQAYQDLSDEAVLTELMKILEQEVRAYPEQYFWVHDRFNIGKEKC